MDNRKIGHTAGCAAGAGLSVLTVNSGLAICRARGDPAGLRTSSSWPPPTVLLLLFRRGQGPPDMERARRAVCAWKVAAVLPSAAAAAAGWGFAVASLLFLGVFCLDKLLLL